jgi:glutamate 5-kinase
MSEQIPATVLIKWGSSNGINHAEQVHSLIESGYHVIAVQSGAIAEGRGVLSEVNRTEMSPPLPSVATIGSGRVFTRLQDQLLEKGVVAGQVLVTHDDLETAERKFSVGKLIGRLFRITRRSNRLKQVLRDNIENNIVSVINENDALSDVEIAAMIYGGDNDGLARHTAQLMGAECLLLLTGGDHIQGLMDHEGNVVRRVDSSNVDYAHTIARETSLDARSEAGRGGILSKVTEARKAAESGIHAYIANSDVDPMDVINGKCGTYFAPE